MQASDNLWQIRWHNLWTNLAVCTMVHTFYTAYHYNDSDTCYLALLSSSAHSGASLTPCLLMDHLTQLNQVLVHIAQ